MSREDFRLNMDIDEKLYKESKKASIDKGLKFREWVMQALSEKLERDGKPGYYERIL